MAKKKKWFKRVISGALAFAVCITSLLGGVNIGDLIASADSSNTGYTNMQFTIQWTNGYAAGDMHYQILAHNPFTLDRDNTETLKNSIEVLCIQKGVGLANGAGKYDVTTSYITTAAQRRLIAEIGYWGGLSQNINANTSVIPSAYLSGAEQFIRSENNRAQRYAAMQALTWEVRAGYRNADTFALINANNSYKSYVNANSTALSYYNAIESVMKQRRSGGTGVTVNASNTTPYKMKSLDATYYYYDISKSAVKYQTTALGKNYNENEDFMATVNSKSSDGWSCSSLDSNTYRVKLLKSKATANKVYSFTYSRNPNEVGTEYTEYKQVAGNETQRLATGSKADPVRQSIKFQAPEEEKGGFTFQKQWKNTDRSSTDAVVKNVIRQLDTNARFRIRQGSTYFVFTKSETGNAYTYSGEGTDASKATLLQLNPSSGKFLVNGLKAGTYTIEEVARYGVYGSYAEDSDGYELYYRVGSPSVTVVAGKTSSATTVEYENYYGYQSLHLTAKKSDTNGKPLAGARYALYVGYYNEAEGKWRGSYVRDLSGTGVKKNADGTAWDIGNKVKEAVSDGNGNVDFGSVPAYWSFGEKSTVYEYTIKEIKAPVGYALSDDGVAGHIIVTKAEAPNSTRGVKGAVKSGSTDFKNSPQRFEILVNKIDRERQKLRGAVFGLYSGETLTLKGSTNKTYSSGDLIAQGTTDSNGQIIFGDAKGQVRCIDDVARTLEDGFYYVQEIRPPKNFVKNPEKRMFYLEKNNLSTQIVFRYESEIPNDWKMGEITAVKKGKKGEKLQGAEFVLYPAEEDVEIDDITYRAGSKERPIAKGTTNSEGILVFNKRVPVGYKYVIEETKAPKGYALSGDSAQIFNLDDNDSEAEYIKLSRTFTNDAYGEVTVVKNDMNGVALAGAKFAIYTSENDAKNGTNAVATGSTKKNSDGTISPVTFTKLLPDTYTYWLVETTPPSGFLAKGTVTINGGTAKEITQAKQPIKLTFKDVDGTPTTYARYSKAVFKNTEQEARITVNKVGTDGVTSIPLANAEFKITAAEDIYSQNGKRIYTKGTQIKSGIKTDSNGKLVISSDQTDGAGTAKAKLYCGTYTVTETKAPNGYRLPSNPSQNVTITADGAPTAQFKNKSITVTNYTGVAIRAYKADKQTGKLIAGARYGLYAAQDVKSLDGKTVLWKKNALIATSTATDTNGVAKFYRSNSTEEISLLFGYKYFVKEIKPPQGYKLDKEWQWVIDLTIYSSTSANLPTLIENNGKNGNEKPNSNDWQKVSIEVHKYDTETRKPLAGAQFKLCAGKNIYKADGTVLYAKNATISTVTTDANGNASFSVKVPVNNTYYVEETKAPINYVYLDKNHFISEYFTPEYKGDEQHFAADYKLDTIEVGNTYQKGTITVIKKDAETETPLAGAEFTLYAMDDVTIPALNKSYKASDPLEKRVITVKTTGADGKAVFGLTSDKKDGVLPVNHRYMVVETKAPKGYTSKGEAQEFELKYAVNVQFVQVDDESTPYYNDYQTGNVVVKKVYNDGTKKPLAGAQFTLYAGEDVLNAAGKTYTLKIKNADGTTKSIELKKGNPIAVSNITGSDGLARFTDGKGNEIKVPVGFKFYVKETKTPAGFKTDSKNTEFTLEYDASVVDYVKMDDKPLEKENKPIEVYVSKKTLTGKNPLAGATLAVINADTNKTFATWKSTGTEKLLSQIPAGNYILRETITPDGYVVTTDIKFKVTADGKVTNASCLNSDLYEVSVKNDIPLIVMFDEVTKVKISKVEINKTTELKGATLKITDKATGKVVKDADGHDLIWTSDGNAKVIEGVFIVGHTYILTETAAPAGYVIAKAIEFPIEDRDTTTGKYVVQTVKMEDDYTHVEISKTDITTGKEIKGATLVILDSKGNVVRDIDGKELRWVTNGEPRKIYKLAKGHYILREELAPNEQGYIRSKDVGFDVDDTKPSTIVQKVEMKDNYTKLAILKTDKDTGKPLAGAVLQLLKADGTVYKEWTTTDKEYRIDYIPIGTYTLHEKTAPAGYVKFKDQPIVINEQDFIDEQKKDPNYIKRVTVEDAIIQVEVDKTSITDGKKVIGAHLVIKDNKDNVYDEWDVTEKAHIIKRMPTGVYTLTETFAPAGYVIANTITFTVEETGEIQKVHMVDDITKLEISKYRANAKDGEDKNLKGAKLTLIDKETGKTVKDRNGEDVVWITDGKAHKIYELLVAGKTYILRELEAPDGYCIADDEEITISTKYAEGQVDKLSLTDKPTKVYLSKKKITGDDELEGAKLQVLDAKTKKVVEKWTSGKTAHCMEAKLLAGGTYILHEEIAPDGYVIANDITFTVSKNGKVDRVVMKDDTTKVRVNKISAVTSDKLAGATLQIIDTTTNTVVDKWITTAEGNHDIEAKLVAGRKYILRETKAPEHYTLAKDIEFTVSTDGSVDNVEMVDFEQKGSIEVTKTTEENKNVSGIKFILTGTSYLGTKVNVGLYTDANGKATFENIPVGDYVITEDKDTVPYAYITAKPQNVTVTYAKTTKVTFFNEEKKGSINVTKQTEGNLNIKDIKFILEGTSDSGRQIRLESTTDANGNCTFDAVPIGTYSIREDEDSVVKAYLIADAQSVQVVYAQQTEVNFFNAEKTGTIKVHKKTEGMVNLEGIRFTLSGTTDSGRQITLEATTDKDGLAQFDKIPLGTYTITENDDGQEFLKAYLIAEPQSVTVVDADQTVDKDFLNTEKSGSIQLTKTTEGNKNIANIKFVLKGTSETGREISIEAVTDENGKATFDNVPIGTYQIFEDEGSVLKAYFIADAKTVEVVYAQTSEVEVFNTEKTGTIKVQKKTEGMINLEGIRFTLKGTSDSGREISIDVKTDKNGVALFENIPLGTYQIIENDDGQEFLKSYLIADKESVTIVDADQTVTKDIFNAEKSGEIRLTKRTSDGTNAVGNIKFILTGKSDTGRDIRIEAITDANGVAVFANVPVGSYVITEDGSTVPSGYLVADKQSVTVLDAQTANVTFVNKPDHPDRPPQTGFSGNTLTVALLLGSIVGIAIAGKKRKEDEEA